MWRIKYLALQIIRLELEQQRMWKMVNIGGEEVTRQASLANQIVPVELQEQSLNARKMSEK